MNTDYILSDVICETFLSEVGKHQQNSEKKALHIRFRTTVDYNKEEGYRYLDLVIFAPHNYVQVWIRSSWNVIPQDELVYDEDLDDTVIARFSEGYRSGSSGWELIHNHDSCWRDGVRNVIQGRHGRLTGLDCILKENWYDVVCVHDLIPEVDYNSKLGD